jgi:hypothetical protein
MNLLIGAISGNYQISDISTWVETSKFNDVKRTLLIYNLEDNPSLVKYLQDNNIECVLPNFDYWGQQIDKFETNTGKVTLENSYNLIHNIRFYHIWSYLLDNPCDNVLITDVKDIYFNSNPFDYTEFENDVIIATSEKIKYHNEAWNREHLIYILGQIGYNELKDHYVYNVGTFGGKSNLIKDICKDIYLLSVGKFKVADQISFNYLIQTSYKDVIKFTTDLATHLHVVNAGLVPFDFNTIKNYPIVHQYDRIPNFKR